MIGDTIYIIKLQPLSSAQFGEGWKVWFKDLPPAAETYTASVYGKVPAPQMALLYKLTHDGKTISPEYPHKYTIEAVGNSYKFV